MGMQVPYRIRTKILGIGGSWISEREKFAHDIRKACESEIQIWKPSFQVLWILSRHSGKEHSDDQKVYPESAQRRSRI